ncbi:unnamed protein product [Amoebophrya sp. A25]|nr:unnamed protein product [Amoebophrya sp. A25]|eukprot:GSA25T00000413001.1
MVCCRGQSFSPIQNMKMPHCLSISRGHEQHARCSRRTWVATVLCHVLRRSCLLFATPAHALEPTHNVAESESPSRQEWGLSDYRSALKAFAAQSMLDLQSGRFVPLEMRRRNAPQMTGPIISANNEELDHQDDYERILWSAYPRSDMVKSTLNDSRGTKRSENRPEQLPSATRLLEARTASLLQTVASFTTPSSKVYDGGLRFLPLRRTLKTADAPVGVLIGFDASSKSFDILHGVTLELLATLDTTKRVSPRRRIRKQEAVYGFTETTSLTDDEGNGKVDEMTSQHLPDSEEPDSRPTNLAEEQQDRLVSTPMGAAEDDPDNTDRDKCLELLRGDMNITVLPSHCKEIHNDTSVVNNDEEMTSEAEDEEAEVTPLQPECHGTGSFDVAVLGQEKFLIFQTKGGLLAQVKVLASIVRPSDRVVVRFAETQVSPVFSSGVEGDDVQLQPDSPRTLKGTIHWMNVTDVCRKDTELANTRSEETETDREDEGSRKVNNNNGALTLSDIKLTFVPGRSSVTRDARFVFVTRAEEDHSGTLLTVNRRVGKRVRTVALFPTTAQETPGSDDEVGSIQSIAKTVSAGALIRTEHAVAMYGGFTGDFQALPCRFPHRRVVAALPHFDGARAYVAFRDGGLALVHLKEPDSMAQSKKQEAAIKQSAPPQCTIARNFPIGGGDTFFASLAAIENYIVGAAVVTGSGGSSKPKIGTNDAISIEVSFFCLYVNRPPLRERLELTLSSNEQLLEVEEWGYQVGGAHVEDDVKVELLTLEGPGIARRNTRRILWLHVSSSMSRTSTILALEIPHLPSCIPVKENRGSFGRRRAPGYTSWLEIFAKHPGPAGLFWGGVIFLVYFSATFKRKRKKTKGPWRNKDGLLDSERSSEAFKESARRAEQTSSPSAAHLDGDEDEEYVKLFSGREKDDDRGDYGPSSGARNNNNKDDGKSCRSKSSASQDLRERYVRHILRKKMREDATELQRKSPKKG